MNTFREKIAITLKKLYKHTECPKCLAEQELPEFLDVFVRATINQFQDEIELLIAKEANIARSESQPTSRLTSLFNKIKDL